MQLEFGFLLGPPDGRYLVRPAADALVESVLVLSTLGAPQRARLGARRPRPVEAAEPEPVPTARATVVSTTPLSSPGRLARGAGPSTRRSRAPWPSSTAPCARTASRPRIPYVAEVSRERALVVRVGYGSGDEVADGRFGEAVELPRVAGGRVKRSMEAPEERFAALLGGREEIHPAEELVLRARADLNAGRPAEAALQCRVAIEALLAAGGADELASHRGCRGRGGQRGTRRRDAGRARGRARGCGYRDGTRPEAPPPRRLERGQDRAQLGHHVAVQLHLCVAVVGRRALGHEHQAAAASVGDRG